MNAGMFHEDLRPVGLYVEDGAEEMRLVTRDGPGNFGLLPNGVLCISDAGADVIESLRFAEEAPDCRFATQSGPMLVIDGPASEVPGKQHQPQYPQRRRRIRGRARLVLAISDEPVNFHHFARSSGTGWRHPTRSISTVASRACMRPGSSGPISDFRSARSSAWCDMTGRLTAPAARDSRAPFRAGGQGRPGTQRGAMSWHAGKRVAISRAGS
jgi:hypothetical protein